MKQTGQGSNVSPCTQQAHLSGKGNRVGRLRATVLGAVLRKHGDATQCRVLVTWKRVLVCLWVRHSLIRGSLCSQPRRSHGRSRDTTPRLPWVTLPCVAMTKMVWEGDTRQEGSAEADVITGLVLLSLSGLGRSHQSVKQKRERLSASPCYVPPVPQDTRQPLEQN